MRILIHVPKGYPRLGGSETLAGIFAKGYAEKGHTVTILTPRSGNQLGEEILEGFRIRRFGSGRVDPGWRYHAGYLLPAAAAFLREIPRHEILQTMGCNRATFIGCAIARVFGKSIVIKLQTAGYEGDLVSFCADALGRRRFERLRHSVDRFAAISAEMLEELSRFGVPPEKIVSIPNCVDERRFRPLDLTAREKLRKRLGLSQKKMILAGGRMVPRKRLDRAIRIFAGALQEQPTLVLWLAGDGPDRGAIENQVRTMGLSEKVRFLGTVGNIEEYLQAADLYLHTADAEGLPLAILEAQSAGVPVVATAIGGVTDAVQNNQTGFLFSPASEADGVQALQYALSERADAVAREARRSVIERFSSERIVHEYLTLFRRLTGEA